MFSRNKILTSSVIGLLAAIILIILYIVIITAISGWVFSGQQFSATWYFIVSLAFGFGLQVGLYTYLRQSIAQGYAGGKVVAVSGTTSTTAMLACCAHYLANIVPFLGLSGAISIIGQFQSQLFWIGILFNFVGIIYLVRQLINFNKYGPLAPQSNITQ